MKKASLRMLTEGAVMLAAAQILGYFRLWRMPWGGSITLSMVPLILYAVRWGLVPGLLSGFAFGLLQLAFDSAFAVGWQSILGDYLLAYTAMGLAGLEKGRRLGVITGSVVGGLARLAVHIVTGATVWAAYMPEEFLGLPMSGPWFYSLLYNLLYMLPNIAVTVAVFVLLYKPMKKYFLAEDLVA